MIDKERLGLVAYSACAQNSNVTIDDWKKLDIYVREHWIRIGVAVHKFTLNQFYGSFSSDPRMKFYPCPKCGILSPHNKSSRACMLGETTIIFLEFYCQEHGNFEPSIRDIP